MTLAAGTRLGPYEVLALLGAGGMGEVYRAKDTRLPREVAIKVLPASFSKDADRLRRFEQEARAASALNHPNIVTLHDIGNREGEPYVVQELLEGDTLRALLAAGRLSTRRALEIAIEIARGLSAAHEKGIVHRDLKPENVFVTSDGRVKILDFGLAKLASPVEEVSRVATLTRQTEPGVLLGTVGYMSPEQAIGRPVDHRSDQFSFGAILYEMTAGARAFARPTAVETLAALLKEEPPPLDSVAPEAPEPLRWIVGRCLAKEPNDRYASTRDLARDLEGVRDRPGGQPAEPAARSPARRRRVLAAALALLGPAILLGVWLLLRGSRDSRSGKPNAGSSSIAVLPFQNYGGRPEDEYFADGMTESLITDLAKVSGLLVIARNSVFPYKNKAVDVRRVGDDLGVRYVLEGSVQRAGESVRINAQLIDAKTGYHLWAEKYDRPMTDIFALEDDISRHIAGALQLALRPKKEPARRPSPSLEAYDAYLRGIARNQRRFDYAIFEGSIADLERAVSLDPGFSRAHAALASAYARRAFEGDPDGVWTDRARREIDKTLSLDPDEAEVYSARATLVWNLENGFPHESAIADFRRALRSNPNLQLAHKGLAAVYYHVGLLDEALHEFEAAARIDPLDLDARYRIPRIHLYQGKYARALTEFDATPEFRSDFQRPLALAHLGRLPEAVAGARSNLTNPTHERPEADAASTLAVILALTGDTRGAEAAIAKSVKEGDGRSHFHHAAYNIGTAYALMKRPQEALQFLEKVAREGMPCYPLFEKDPFLDSLRGNPDFAAFLAAQKAQWERLRGLA